MVDINQISRLHPTLPNEVAISAMDRAICLNLAMLLAVANFMASNKSEAVLKCRLAKPTYGLTAFGTSSSDTS